MSEIKIKRSFAKPKDLVARFQQGEELCLTAEQAVSLLEYIEKFIAESHSIVWNEKTPDFDVLVELRDVLLAQGVDPWAKLKIAKQEFYNAVTPTDFANSFNGGSDSTIVLNDVTVETQLMLPPPSIKLSVEDKAQIMAFNYEDAARQYAERRAEKL